MKKATISGLILLLCFFSDIAKVEGKNALNILDIHALPENNVEMIISVLDEHGKPLKGLSKANFKVYIEGEEVNDFLVEPVSSAKNPLSIVLGIDISGSMNGAPITEAKKAASVFLDELDKDDVTAIMVFGSNVTFLSDFTKKKHELREKIQNLEAKDMYTWLYQATYEGQEKASKAPTSRVALVLLTDGKDDGSPKKEEDIIAKSSGTQIPIFAIGFGQKAEIEYLKRIASISGGYFLYTPKAEELTELYSEILDKLKNQYRIQMSFQKPAGNYVGIVALNYRGEETTTRRGFLYSRVTDGKEPIFQRNILEVLIPGFLIILAAAAVVGVFLIKKANRKKEIQVPVKTEIKHAVSMMVNKKIHPITLGNVRDFSQTVLQPSAVKGDAGFEIDIPPVPIHFVLIDNKSQKEFDEVIIARYDDERDHLFSPDKTYLLLSDNSISRPEEGREGHARIFKDRETGAYQIEDLGSASGTKYRENNLQPNESLSIENEDVVTVGRISLKFYDKRPMSGTTF